MAQDIREKQISSKEKFASSSNIISSNNFMEMVQNHTKNSLDIRIPIIIINAEVCKYSY